MMIALHQKAVSLIGPRSVYIAVGTALGWWLLAGYQDAVFSGFAIVITLSISVMATPAPSHRWRLMRLVRFLPYFIVESWKGGVDVTRRALQADMPLQPVLIAYPLRLPMGSPTTVFAITMTLLPGTLSAELTPDTVIVHSLTPELAEALPELEARVAELFGIALLSRHGEV